MVVFSWETKMRWKTFLNFLAIRSEENDYIRQQKITTFRTGKILPHPLQFPPLFFFFGFIFPRSAADKNQSEGRIILFFFFIILFWLLKPANPREVGGRKILLRLLRKLARICHGFASAHTRLRFANKKSRKMEWPFVKVGMTFN